ncbi:MAG: ribbon-helix-helix protein, CopG family [Planctomycetes bacterium]|nr:ribbon-helix-helix protein, CopG family [Planctomycetota bacterium]
MRTTLDLDEHLYRALKRVAAETGRSLREVVEEALREAFAARRKRRAGRPIRLPVSRHAGGLLPGISLDDSAALLDRMEGR